MDLEKTTVGKREIAQHWKLYSFVAEYYRIWHTGIMEKNSKTFKKAAFGKN